MKYKYQGIFELPRMEESINNLLRTTPFSFEIKEDVILILLPEKKEYNLCGSIKGALGNLPLPFAHIYFKASNKGTQSDESANFVLNILAHKHEPVSISYIGYETKQVMAQEWTKGDCLNIILKEDTDLLSTDIIIRDYILKGISEGKDYGSISLDYKTLTKSTSTQEHDALKTVQFLPGINSVDESASNIHIRGATPDQNLILWEDAALYDAGHMFGMISSINPFVVDKIDVYKGVFHPKYDNRIGGVVDVSLSDQIKNRINVGVGATMTEAHAYLDVPVLKDKLAVILGGRQSVTYGFKSPTLLSYREKIFQNTIILESTETSEDEEEEGEELENDLSFYDINAKINFRPSDKVFVKASLFNSHNKFNYQSSLFEGDIGFFDEYFFDSDAFSTKVAVDWTKHIQSDFYLIISSYDNAYYSSYGNTEDEEFTKETKTVNEISDTQLGSTHSFKLSSHSNLELGYTYEKKSVNFSIEESSLYEAEIESDDLTLGNFHNLFASHSIRTKKFILETGLRNTIYEGRKGWHVAPRFNLQYLVTNTLKYKLSAGQFYQFISTVKDFGKNDFVGNNNLWVLYDRNKEDVLNSKKISTGFAYTKKGFLLDFEAYHNKSNGLSNILTNGNNLIYDASITSDVWGIDFLVKKNWKNYKFWLNYTLSENKYTAVNSDMNLFPANNDRLHDLNLVSSFNLGDFSLSATYYYRSGMPFSKPSGIREYFDDMSQTNISELSFEKFNNNRLKDYQRVDLNFGYHFVTGFGMNGEVSFSVLNVLNTNNIFARTFYIGDVSESAGLEIFSIDKKLLKRTPQLLVRVNF